MKESKNAQRLYDAIMREAGEIVQTPRPMSGVCGVLVVAMDRGGKLQGVEVGKPCLGVEAARVVRFANKILLMKEEAV